MTSLSHAENRNVSRHARPLLPFHLSFHRRVAAAAVTPFVRPRLSLGRRRAVLAFCTNFLPVASPSLRDRDRRHCRLSYRQLSVCRVCDSIEALAAPAVARCRTRVRNSISICCSIYPALPFQLIYYASASPRSHRRSHCYKMYLTNKQTNKQSTTSFTLNLRHFSPVS